MLQHFAHLIALLRSALLRGRSGMSVPQHSESVPQHSEPMRQSGEPVPRWAALWLPQLAALALFLGAGLPPASPPLGAGGAGGEGGGLPEQLRRAELPALERSAARPERHLREGQPPQPWPDLPPHPPQPPLHRPPVGQPLVPWALHLRAPQRLAHWGKRQLEGG